MRTNICSSCRDPHERIGQRFCKACHAAYMRANRAKHSELTDEQRKKANARSYANSYVKRGLITPLPCQECGDTNAQKHHEDYDRPLEVTWLCRTCHLEHHKQHGLYGGKPVDKHETLRLAA